MKERSLSNIYIPPVSTENQNTQEIEYLWKLHCQQKLLFRELITADADSEEILEALETFIGTSNMDAYLLDIEPQLQQWENRYLIDNKK